MTSTLDIIIMRLLCLIVLNRGIDNHENMLFLRRFDLSSVPNVTRHYLDEVSHIFVRQIRREGEAVCNLEHPPDILVRFDVHSPYMNLTWTTDESYSVVVATESE